ncbi:MAG: NAD(P)-dependent oxidoreductase [Actinobacteria bacterium]|nr:NAD(P)-dependent oxidoreductase [Actinomycetota bacterium]
MPAASWMRVAAVGDQLDRGTIERWALPNTTVVTGAVGWLGRALLHRLLGDPQRARLRLLAQNTSEAAELQRFVDDHAMNAREQPVVEIVVGDVAKANTAARLLHQLGHDTDVVHTAGVIHPRRVREFYEVNSNGTRHLAVAAADRGVRRFVHISSNSPFGTNADTGDTFRGDEPFNPYLGYGKSKMAGELAIGEAAAAGLDATIVRPPWFYGPFQPPRQTTFFRLIRGGKFPVIGSGDQRRSMVFVDNLVDGILCAELTPAARGKGYWIADQRAYTVAEIVDTVGRALVDEGLAVKPPATHLPPVASRIAEIGDRILQGIGVYQQQLHVLGEMGHTIAVDISRATAEIGYVPKVALHEGMRRSIRWCLDHGLEL